MFEHLEVQVIFLKSYFDPNNMNAPDNLKLGYRIWYHPDPGYQAQKLKSKGVGIFFPRTTRILQLSSEMQQT
jgi:hypothetical protein